MNLKVFIVPSAMLFIIDFVAVTWDFLEFPFSHLENRDNIINNTEYTS